MRERKKDTKNQTKNKHFKKSNGDYKKSKEMKDSLCHLREVSQTTSLMRILAWLKIPVSSKSLYNKLLVEVNSTITKSLYSKFLNIHNYIIVCEKNV